jgi:hypothetical protein
MACYYDGLSFRVFDKGSALIKAFHIVNPLLPLPSRQDIATKLLDEQYLQISKEVNTLLTAEPHINFSVDETTNIRHQRILNICTNTTTYGAFYQTSEAIDIESVTATALAQWIISSMRRLLANRSTEALNSIAMDTCATARAAGRQIQGIAQFHHVFIVTCDSHGLQLLIKDLLEKGPYVDTFNEAQGLVRSFTSSPKQLGILRGIMRDLLGKEYALLLSVITRWGSQVRMLRSVLRLEAPIKAYYTQLPPDAPTSIQNGQVVVRKPSFWLFLRKLLELLILIDEELQTSEAERATLPHVIPRWNRIRAHIKTQPGSLDSL